jgi:hypothetical protein
MRRPNVRSIQERQAPCFVGIDVGKWTHYAAVVAAHGSACLPKALQFAHTRQGYTQIQATIAEATAHASPTEVTIGCEATGPYWLSLFVNSPYGTHTSCLFHRWFYMRKRVPMVPMHDSRDLQRDEIRK